MHVREERDGHDARDRVRGDPPGEIERPEPRGDPFGNHVLAIHPEAEAGQRHANLRRRDVPIAPLPAVEDRDDAAGAAVALRRQVFEAGARRADDRKLRGDEEAVGEHEQQDETEREEGGGHPSILFGGLFLDSPRQHRHERAPLHAFDLELEITDDDALAWRRQVPERLRDEAVDGRRVRLPLGAEKRRRILDRHLTRQPDAAVGQASRRPARLP